MTLVAGARIGKYVVEGELGRGGFGVIYVARDTALDRSVALKVLRAEHVAKQDVVQRFLQEARAAAKIDHPGIVTVHECGLADDGTVYIAMELLRGETLTHRLARGPLALDAAVAICRQAAAALGAAHRAAIVHRDLKPDNLMLCPDRAVLGGERVKVLDFGIAKLAESMWQASMQTHHAVVLGTPMYMSPEQCRSTAQVDARSDIYALGCIVFQIVCGRPPYDGDAGQLIAKHQLAPVPELRALAPAVPASVDALVRAMLAKEPEARPQSMEQVEAALEACLGGGVAASASWPPPPVASVPAAAPGAPTQMQMQMQVQMPAQPGPQTTLSSGVHGGPTSRSGRRRGVVIGGTALAVIAIGVAIAASVGGASHPRAVASAGASAGSDAAVVAALPPPPAPDAAVAIAIAVELDAAVAAPPPPLPPPLPDAGAPKPPATKPKAAAVPLPAAPPPPPPPAPADPCDLAGHTKRGQDASKREAHAQAVQEFEAALRCKPGDPQLVALAYAEACLGHFTKRARRLFAQLPATGAVSQAAMRDICQRAGINPARSHAATPTPAPASSDDSE